MTRYARATLCAALIVAAASVPAAAYPRPGHTEHISVGPDGSEGNGNCFDHDVNANGRFVAFTCSASNLVLGDTNQSSDVFVRDLQTGVTEFVSVSSEGAQTNANSFHPSISDDGRFVAFASDASNLVVGDTNEKRDVFVRDLQAGITERVSLSTEGNEGNGESELPSISGDGTLIAFQSRASNLVPDDSNTVGLWPFDVFVRDLTHATTERVSVASDGEEQNGRAHRVSLSPEGRFVAFQSLATNLISEDTNDVWDVFVHDRVTGTTERVSEASDGTEGDGSSRWASISADGRYVAFDSLATNLVPNDDNQESGGSGNDDGRDVFVHDRDTGITERVSVDSNGAERPDFTTARGTPMAAEDRSYRPSISADGRFVAFENNRLEQAAGQPNLFLRIYDVHRHDRLAGATEVVTVTTDGENPRGTASYMPSISADGRSVAFSAHANNIAPTARNNAIDVFVRDLGPTVGTFGISALPADTEVEVSGRATFSGRPVASASDPSGDSGAEDAGADLTGADVVFRPEQEDLLLKWSVFDLPEPAAGLPGVVYGLRLEVAGVSYEARALRAAATTAPPESPHFALHRCEPVCIEERKLEGGIGTTGDEVRMSVPLDALSIAVETGITSLRAYAALGEAAAGEVVPLDEVALPDATLPAPTVTLGIAPAGTPETGVAFDTAAGLAEGEFSGTLDISSLSSGDFDVWARACLGETCGATSVPVTIGDPAVERKETTVELTVEGQGQDMVLRARLAELDAPHTPIAGRTIDFYSDAEFIGSAETDANGVATVGLPPGHRGANRTYEAIFEGDDSYEASSDERAGRGGGQGDEARSGLSPSPRRSVIGMR